MTRNPLRKTRTLVSLLKPRIAGLLCLTGVGGVLAAGGLPAGGLLTFVVAGFCMAGGSAALNCYYDRDIDPLMERTADRPIPSGELPAWSAPALAAVLLAVGTAVAWVALPVPALAYMWLGVLAYVGLYTVALKRRHWSAVVLGGSAGAFPVLAGWSAVHPGSWALAPAPLLMAAVVFAWTPAHAWALAFVYREDFARAGIPTLPVVADGSSHRRAVWWSAVATVALAAAVVPFAGTAYVAVLVGAGTPFLLAFRWYRQSGTERAAVRAFFGSNHFLALLFVAWGAGGVLEFAGPTWVWGPVLAIPVALSFRWLWRAGPSLDGVEADCPDLERSLPRAVRGRLPRPVLAALAAVAGLEVGDR